MKLRRRPAYLALFALCACPDPGPHGGANAPTVCVKAYDKCTLASGVLGVCDPIDCAAGQAAPCFVCRSQH
jgi:hypothetical protein